MIGSRTRGHTDEQIDALDDVEEDLVLAVADALRAPGDGVGDGHGWADLDLELVRLLGDVSGQRADEGGSASGDGEEHTHSWRILLSVVCGYPKSIISSMSS